MAIVLLPSGFLNASTLQNRLSQPFKLSAVAHISYIQNLQIYKTLDSAIMCMYLYKHTLPIFLVSCHHFDVLLSIFKNIGFLCESKHHVLII